MCWCLTSEGGESSSTLPRPLQRQRQQEMFGEHFIKYLWAKKESCCINMPTYQHWFSLNIYLYTHKYSVYFYFYYFTREMNFFLPSFSIKDVFFASLLSEVNSLWIIYYCVNYIFFLSNFYSKQKLFYLKLNKFYFFLNFIRRKEKICRVAWKLINKKIFLYYIFKGTYNFLVKNKKKG